MNVCIIPARGGSKRIPRKNIRPFCGKPMIAYSIEAARASGVFNRIIASTDSTEIADVARDHGAEVPFDRPAGLSNDQAGTDDVLVHALQWLADHGEHALYACCLYATAPFVRPEDLVRGLDTLKEHRATSAFTITSFSYPIYRGLKINSAGALEMIWPEHRLTRSQDLPEAYHDAGQFYWLDVAKYLASPQVFAPDAVPIPLPRHLVQDIDTGEDWVRAELMYKAQFT